jgi:hypothetical protein
MQFSEIQHILRNAVCAPPPSPVVTPIKLEDLEEELEQLAAISDFLRLQSDEDAMEDEDINEEDLESGVLAFSNLPVVSRKRAFEEIFGEDSDEEEDSDEGSDEGGLADREARASEASHSASLGAIQEYQTYNQTSA